jgi:ferrous iron transport protein A
MDDKLLTALDEGDTATIVELPGGSGFLHRLRGIGIKENKTVRVIAKHPFSGPVVLEVDGKQVTIGRGMAERIAVAVEKTR